MDHLLEIRNLSIELPQGRRKPPVKLVEAGVHHRVYLSAQLLHQACPLFQIGPHLSALGVGQGA